MSAPKIGDIVLVLDGNSAVCPAIVKTVSGTTVDVLFASGAGWGVLSGLTEVADSASLGASNWARRDNCG